MTNPNTLRLLRGPGRIFGTGREMVASREGSFSDRFGRFRAICEKDTSPKMCRKTFQKSLENVLAIFWS